jgi:YbbR domain-containing protein
MEQLPYGLNALKEYSKDYILQNTGLKILALLITCVLWLSVASRSSQVTLNPVPIEFSNPPQDLTISKYDTLSAKVFLRGPKDVIDSLRSSELAVIADLQGIEPGVRVIPLRVDAKRLPPSIDEQSVEIEPRSIRVTIERIVEAELPIKPRIEGEIAAGYEIYQVVSNPPGIKVTAPASHIKDITYVSTESVNVGAKTESFSQQVAVDTGSPNVTPGEENLKVMLTVIIGEARKERAFEKIPVTFINVPQGLLLQPKFVRVSLMGPPSILDALSASEVEVIVDYATVKSPAMDIKLEARVPGHTDKVTVKTVDPAVIRLK